MTNLNLEQLKPKVYFPPWSRECSVNVICNGATSLQFFNINYNKVIIYQNESAIEITNSLQQNNI